MIVYDHIINIFCLKERRQKKTKKTFKVKTGFSEAHFKQNTKTYIEIHVYIYYMISTGAINMHERAF